MSQENVERYRQGIDAFNRRDRDAFLRTLRPRSGRGFPSSSPSRAAVGKGTMAPRVVERPARGLPGLQDRDRLGARRGEPDNLRAAHQPTAKAAPPRLTSRCGSSRSGAMDWWYGSRCTQPSTTPSKPPGFRSRRCRRRTWRSCAASLTRSTGGTWTAAFRDTGAGLRARLFAESGPEARDPSGTRSRWSRSPARRVLGIRFLDHASRWSFVESGRSRCAS